MVRYVISPEKKQKMVEMRLSGATYPEIMGALDVTKERCIAYLKNIKPESTMVESAMSVDWKLAEHEGRGILSKLGFTTIHNLNEVCSFPPYWDYLALRDNEWWLIDVTINGQKSLIAKNTASVDGYKHAVLLKTNDEWKFIKITFDTEVVIGSK